MSAAPQLVVSPDKLAEQVIQLLLEGGTLGSVYDYSEKDYELLYGLGHNLYSQAHYEDAVKIFGFLVIHNHLERRFIKAFASSLQMIKNYTEAIKYYALAAAMDMSDPLPTFYSCECLVSMGHIQEAHEGLSLVVEQCVLPKHAALKMRALALQNLIEKQIDIPKELNHD